jgi:hypothetical protein
MILQNEKWFFKTKNHFLEAHPKKKDFLEVHVKGEGVPDATGTQTTARLFSTGDHVVHSIVAMTVCGR